MFFNILAIVKSRVKFKSTEVLKLKKSTPLNKVVSKEPHRIHFRARMNREKAKRSKTAIRLPYDYSTSLDETDIELVDLDEEACNEFIELKKLFNERVITWHERTVVRIIIIMRNEARKRDKIIDTFAERYGDDAYYEALDGLKMMKENGLFNTRMRRKFSLHGIKGETKRRPIIWLDMNKEWQLWSYSCEFGYHKRYLLLDCLSRSGMLYEAIKVVHDAIFFPLHHKRFPEYPAWKRRITGEKHQKWKGDDEGIDGKAPTALQLKYRHQKRIQRERDRRLGIKRCA